MKHFERLLTAEDYALAEGILGGAWREPDLTIAPDGLPYLYRWHLIPRDKKANVYFHIQVASDPERPLHDHPWDNTSVILSGGYDEIIDFQPWFQATAHIRSFERKLRKGDVAHRSAAEAHRLILPADIPYTMTLFTTGPNIRDWGFWFPEGWRPASEVTRYDPATRKSLHTGHRSALATAPHDEECRCEDCRNG